MSGVIKRVAAGLVVVILTVTHGPLVRTSVAETTPLLFFTPQAALPGQSVLVSGIGFAPESDVELSVALGNAAATKVGAARTDTHGRFVDFPVLVPDGVLTGSFTVLAKTDKNPGGSVSARGDIITHLPNVSIDDEVGVAGKQVTVSANGFIAGETVSVYLNALGEQPFASLVADKKGGISEGHIVMPYGPVGNNTLIFIGEKSKVPVTLNYLMIGFFPTVTLSNYAPKGDEVVGIKASGFGPSEQVRIHLNTLSSPPIAVATTDQAGSLVLDDAFPVPFGWLGKQAFLLVGEKSGAMVTADFEVGGYGPYLEPSTWSARAGTTITFYGNGFARFETVHVFRAATATEPAKEASCFRTDQNGAVFGGGSYTIQETDPPGKLQLLLVGSKSQAQVPLTIEVMKLSGKLPVAGVPPNTGCQAGD